MIPARLVPLGLALPALLAACGQKGDLRLPQGKSQVPGQAAPAQPAPSAAPTPPAQSAE